MSNYRFFVGIATFLLLSGCSGLNFQPLPGVTKDIDDYTMEEMVAAKKERLALKKAQEAEKAAKKAELAKANQKDVMTFEQWQKAKEMNSQEYQEYLEYLEYVKTIENK